MVTNGDHQEQPEQTYRRRLSLSVGWTLLIFLLCLFLPAGTWAWSRGWLFFFVIVVTSIVITLYLRRVNPDVIAARVNRHQRNTHCGFDTACCRACGDRADPPL